MGTTRVSAWPASAVATCTGSRTCRKTCPAGCTWTKTCWPLDAALNNLAAADERLARVVELRYFAGLSELEIATLMERSERSVRRDWQKARLYLLAALQDGPAT